MEEDKCFGHCFGRVGRRLPVPEEECALYLAITVHLNAHGRLIIVQIMTGQPHTREETGSQVMLSDAVRAENRSLIMGLIIQISRSTKIEH